MLKGHNGEKVDMWDKLKSLIYVYLTDRGSQKYQSMRYDEIIPTIKSCTIPTEQARNIYKARAGSSAALSGSIKGFDKLLYELDRVEDSTVSIHSVSASSIKLIIFTNPGITRALGVLLLPEQNYNNN